MPDERISTTDREHQQASGDRLAEAAGMLASAGVGLLLGGCAVFVMRQRLWWPVYAMWGAGVAALVAALALQPRRALALLRGRGVRYGSNTALLIVLVIAIAAFVNYIAGRHHKRFDLTRAQANTLSPQTIRILKGLRQPITISAFYRQGDPGYQGIRDLLQEYRYGSRRVKTQLIDPDVSPAVARQYGVTGEATTIVEGAGQKEEVYAAGEQEITRAILKLTRPRKKKVYFVQGHGEHDIDSGEGDGYSTASGALASLNYEVDKLLLPGKEQIPGDCDVLVVAGPRTQFDPREIEAIKAYLYRGGKALVMVDPDPQGISLAEILELWGVKPLPDVVVEPSLNLFGDAASVTVMDFAMHDITRPFLRGRALLAVFVLVRAFDLEPKQGIDVQDLIRTSPQSWLESDFTGTISPDRRERRGPLTIGAVVTGGEPAGSAGTARQPTTRMVVFGDSDFVANSVIQNGINKDLFLNSVGWLAESEELISIQPKEPESSPLMLTLSGQRAVFVIALIAMPLLPIIVGGIMSWRRR
jgi:ABC-type uncharacterized transport system involved in gliding motility auxiliary subunit